MKEGGRRVMGKTGGKKKLPLVSVVTTVYNRAQVLERAICSVLGQTYANIEHIIIDAGSSDGTLEIIEKYEDLIEYFVSEPDSGMYEGLNKGLSLVKGDYILVLNSDDWYYDFAIQTLVESAEESGSNMVCALADEYDKWGRQTRQIPKVPFGSNTGIRMPLRHETMLISRELHEEIGLYDPCFRIIADLKLTQSIYYSDAKTLQLDEYVMGFRNTGMASYLSKELLIERKKLLLENYPGLHHEHADVLSGEYTGNVSDYISIASCYPDDKRLFRSIRGFLGLHDVFRSCGKECSIFFFANE